MVQGKETHGQQWMSADDRKAAADITARRALDEKKREVTYREWWQTARPTKLTLVWAFLAGVVLAILLGFTLGGWVTAGTAQQMADTAAQNAVVARLAPICVAQFNLDPGKVEKLAEMKALNSYERGSYMMTQTWAAMPGEDTATKAVADACVKLLMQNGQ